jgi:hypothetical protein
MKIYLLGLMFMTSMVGSVPGRVDGESGPGETLPEITAGRVAIPPEIDGQVTDAGWQNAPETSPFELLDRPEPAQYRTTAQVAVDDQALYLAFHCSVDRERPRRAYFTDRDAPVYLDDCVEVLLAPTGNPDYYFHFAVNSRGASYDAVRHPVWGRDTGWDGLWTAAAAPTPEGWSAEIALPLATLAEAGTAEVWRMNLARKAWHGTSTPYLAPDAQCEESAWSCPYGWLHTPDRFGWLKGVVVDPQTLALTARLISPAVLVPGPNPLRWKVSNRSSELRSLEFQVRLGEAQANRYCRVPARGETEVECTLMVPAPAQGPSRLQASLTDRASQRQVWGGLVPVQIRPALILIPDRSFYTTEEQAFLRLDPAPSVLTQLDLAAHVSVPDADGRFTGREVSWAEPVEIDLRGLPVGRHPVRAELRAAGERLAWAEATLWKLPPAEHCVQVGGDRRLWVDGHPFFPLGFYWVAREERHYRLLAETGFNTVVYEAVPQGGVTDDFAAAEATLDLLQRCGLKGIVDFSWSVRGPRSEMAEIQRGVERLRHHPAVLAWEIVDEPHGFGGVGPEELQQAYDLIHSLDPYHPIFVNFYVAGYSTLCLNALDILGRDPYPVPREPLGMVATSVEEMARLSGGTKPLWITLQAFSEPPAFTRPTFMQVRCMTYLALLRGANGLLYFLYGYPGCPAGEPMPDAYPSLWGEFPRLAREIPALLPILAASPGKDGGSVPNITVETTSPGLEWSLREYKGHLHLLAVNATPRPLELTWHFPPPYRQAQVEILFGQAQWDLEDGTLWDVLDGYATRVYVVR